MEVFLECLSSLRVGAFVGNVGVFLVAGALVVLGSVSLPVPQAHPAEVVLAMVALHVVAAAVLLDADIALGALQKVIILQTKSIEPQECDTHVFRVSGNVVCRLAVVRALCQPEADRITVCGGVVVATTLETEKKFSQKLSIPEKILALPEDDLARRALTPLDRLHWVVDHDDALAALARAEPHAGVGADVVLEGGGHVTLGDHAVAHVGEHEALGSRAVAVGRHAGEV